MARSRPSGKARASTHLSAKNGASKAPDKKAVRTNARESTTSAVKQIRGQSPIEYQGQSTLLDLTHDAILVRDMEGGIQFWNRGAEEMYGWKRREALGKITHELLRTEFPAELEQIEAELLREERWEGELAHVRKDGQRIFVNSRWALRTQADAEPIILEINTDITERRQSEERLRQLSGHLMRVQDEERRRIARELHDSTGQKLAAAKLHLDTIVREPDLKAVDPRISETLELVTDAFQDIRTISQLLHPPMLDEAGLESATNWLVDGFSVRAKIPVKFTVSGQIGRLEQPVELALFRIIQESLSNIHRHSCARQAQVDLSNEEGTITLEVRDDGKGLPPELLSGGENEKQVLGVGVLGMRERVTQLGGVLEIKSGRYGTTVRASVPKGSRVS